MNTFYDANAIYDAGSKAMRGSPFKYGTQLFEMNHLLRTAEIQRDMMNGTYRPGPGQKFQIRERGKSRFITSNTMVDKTVNHILRFDRGAGNRGTSRFEGVDDLGGSALDEIRNTGTVEAQ